MRFWFNAILLILRKSTRTLIELGPYMITGVLLGEIIKYTSWTRLIYKGISRSPRGSTLVAVILGMVSPLCTYGTVPVILYLFSAGVHLAPLVVFLSASTLMNPQLFVLTWGGLGMEIALVRVGAVFLFGLLLGALLYKVPVSALERPRLTRDVKEEEILSRKPKPFTWKGYAQTSWASLQFVAFYMIIGILLGTAMEVLVPRHWMIRAFEPGAWHSVLLSSIIGVPLYACGGGVIPFIRSCMSLGMSKGAAMAFLLVGPATRITPLVSLGTIIKPRYIVLYVILVILFSVTLGVLYQ